MKPSSSLPGQIGIVGIYAYLCYRSDFISALPLTCLLSIPLLINLCLAGSITRPSTHRLNNLSSGLYVLLIGSLLVAHSFDALDLVLMALVGTMSWLPIIILFPVLWIVTWRKRDPEPHP